MRIAGESSIVPDDVTKIEIFRAGISKVVTTYKLCVGTDGVPYVVQMLKSSRFPAYDARLQAAMMLWRYRPYTIDGVATRVCTGVTFIYQQPASPRSPVALIHTPPQAQLALISRGTEPAAPLRLSPTRGHQQSVVMTFRESVQLSFPGQNPQPPHSTSLMLSGITEVTQASDGGDLRYVTDIEKSELNVDGDIARDTVASVKIEGGASTLGETSRTVFHPPQTRRDADGLDRAYQSLVTWPVLPRDPVGLGAQWEVTTHERHDDLQIIVVTRYTLTARTATSATITGELKISPSPKMLQDRRFRSVTGYGRLAATIYQGRLYPQLERAMHLEVKVLTSGNTEVTYAIEESHGFSLPSPQGKPAK